VKVEVRDEALPGASADLVALGLYEGSSLPQALAGAPGAASAQGKLNAISAVFPPQGPRTIVVGLGKREEADAERLRAAAALAAKEAGRL